MDEDIEVDILGDFDSNNALNEMRESCNSFNKLDKEVLALKNKYFNAGRTEEIVKISKAHSDLDQDDVPIDIESVEDNRTLKESQSLSSSASNTVFTSWDSLICNDQTDNAQKISKSLKRKRACKPSSSPINLHYQVSSAVGFGSGGITLRHDENGFITKVAVQNKSGLLKASSNLTRKSCEINDEPNYCKRFATESSAPFHLLFYLEALLIAEFHSHISHRSVSIGLFRGFFEEEKKTVHVTSCFPLTNSNSFLNADVTDVHHDHMIVGWYFSYPMAFTDSSEINLPIHTELRSLFAKNITDPFFMMAISPYTRVKSRCIITFESYSYLIDYKVFFSKNISLSDVTKKMEEIIASNDNRVKFNKVCSKLNNKTYGQLCYESIRRLLDSPINRVPSEPKEELIHTTKNLVEFNVSPIK